MTTIRESIVDALSWGLTGRHSDPPPSIAELSPEEQAALYEAADRVIRTRGEGFAEQLMVDLAHLDDQ